MFRSAKLTVCRKFETEHVAINANVTVSERGDAEEVHILIYRMSMLSVVIFGAIVLLCTRFDFDS